METKRKTHKSKEINFENDVISICVYCWDTPNSDIAVLFLKKDDKIIFPSRHISKEFIKDKDEEILGYGTKNHSKSASAMCSNKFKELSWSQIATDLVNKAFGEEIEKESTRLLYLLRSFSTIKEKYFSHAIFGVKISITDINKLHEYNDYLVLGRSQISEDDGYKVQRKKILWILEDLYKNTAALENASNQDEYDSYNDASNESKKSGNIGAQYEELNPQIFYDKSKGSHSISPDNLFESPGYSFTDRVRLYEEFLHLSFPFSSVIFSDMKPLLKELGFDGYEKKAFRALDEDGIEEINVNQFMMGLTAMDPITEHGGEPAEFRCRQIFRYYDEDNDGFLNSTDLKGMIRDIKMQQDCKPTSEELQNSVENAFKIFGVSPFEKISIPKFLVSVGNLRFRGTSGLYRANNTIPAVVKKMRERRNCSDVMVSIDDKKRKRDESPTCSLFEVAKKKHNLNQNPFSTDLFKESFDGYNWQSSFGYILAEHTVKVKRSGSISNVSNLLDMERAGQIDNTGLSISEPMEISSIETSSKAHQKPRVDKQFSMQAFNTKSLPNEILLGLRYFEYESKEKKAMSWGQIEKHRLGKYIKYLCDSMKEILEQEPRLIQIVSPCYVLGDLHGNFKDLIFFEKALWRIGPHLTPANFLFLGDYVDRGDYGIEVIIYLFAQKLRAPNRFHLLRGNHEIRDIQKQFSFYKECLSKFGPSEGAQIWENINQVFDRMPLAAVVDKRIFCIHGGIPKHDVTLDQIKKIPCPLPNPQLQSPLAWQLMWNDPIAPADLNDDIRQQLQKGHGFAANRKRQTAFVFDENAFERFLDLNHLSHVIRAHEVKLAGFQIQQKGRLLTVFSSSLYCGANNEAACVLVHDSRIRIIRLDTN